MHSELTAEQSDKTIMVAGDRIAPHEAWWRDAVVYEIYVRSFADGDGDGTGDLAGVRSRLDHLSDLGVDALWFTPWYLSPLADGGYDVQDYRAIDPAFGDLVEAEVLIAEAAERGIRTIVDIVPNHVSSEHPWFRAALADPSAPERALFWFRPGRGENGDLPPTEWTSSFGGPAWTRTTDPDGSPGQWYLHLFAPEQPDLDWGNPAVQREHADVLRFWFDRGVAGVRIDSAAFPAKDPALPVTIDADAHPHLDRDEVHEIYREWRAIADEYSPPRMLVGEVWLADDERFARYLRDDEMHGAFNFEFMVTPWDAAALRSSIQRTVTAHASISASPTWALGNHDVTRAATRYGRADSSFSFDAKRFGTETDAALGLRRARAAALLAAALPGSLYVYQGDELGLPEVEDLPLHALRDPMHERSGGVDPGRDGCRIPLPWTASEPASGFGGDPWLPQPDGWSELAVDRQLADPLSTLALYRSLLRIRRAEASLHDAPLEWMPSDAHTIAFRRGDLLCLTNFGSESVALPLHHRLLISSAPLDGERLPGDCAAWLRL